MTVELISDDLDDDTDGVCMDNILMSYEELRTEDEEYMKLLVERLKGQAITWEQPWYQQPKSLTRPLTEHNKEGANEYRTGIMSTEEAARVKKNWRKFRKLFDLPNKLICIARWRNIDKSRNPNTAEEMARHFVTAYLAQGLNRNLYQVYQYIVSHYGAPMKGPYTPHEEKMMEICFKRRPAIAVTYLSAVLGREPRGIAQRLEKYMQNDIRQPKREKLKWTLPLATKLLHLVMKHSKCPLEKLKYARFDQSVWLKVGAEIGYYFKYIIKFWYANLHVQLFVKCDVSVGRLRRKLFKILKSSSYQVWRDIQWKEVLKRFPDGFTHHILYRAIRNVVVTYPNFYKTPLYELADYGLQRIKSFPRRRLKTIALNGDGDLEIVRYNDKLQTIEV